MTAANQSRILTLSAVVIIFGTGAAWADAKRDVAQLKVEKVARDEYVTHLVSEANIQTSTTVVLNQIKAHSCLKEKDQYARFVLGCSALALVPR